MEETPQEPQPLTPPPRRIPFVPPVLTMGLILANVGAHLLVARASGTSPLSSMFLGSLGGDPETARAWQGALERLGWNQGSLVRDGEYWRLITAVFLHGGIVHLGCNMIGLWNLGQFMEMAYGRIRYVVIYVGAGIAGSLASTALAPMPSVGASGALFGLIGCGLVFSLRYRRYLPPGVGTSLFSQLMIWTVAILAIGHYARVFDNAGHIGGLVGGALVTSLLHSRFAPGLPGRLEKMVARLGFGASVLILGACLFFLLQRTFSTPEPALERTFEAPPGWTLRVPRDWDAEIVSHEHVIFRDPASHLVLVVNLGGGGEEILETTAGELADRLAVNHPVGQGFRIHLDDGVTRYYLARGPLLLTLDFQDAFVPEEMREAIFESLGWEG